MKHVLPSLERLIRTTFHIIGPADLELYQKGHPVAEDFPVFVKQPSGPYGLLAPSTEADGRLRIMDVRTIQAEESFLNISSAFCSCSLAIVLQDGEPAGYVAASDVIEAVVAAHRHLEAYFSTTLEALNPDVAITLIDDEGRVAGWTTGAEHIFSIQKNEIIGKPASDFFPVDRLQSLKTLETGESVQKNSIGPGRTCSFSLTRPP